VTEPQLALLCALAAFVSGALPFAVWLTRVIAHSDVRTVGDGNPGAGNAFQAGGWHVGVPALVLEVGKAGLPVGVARLTLGLSGWALVAVAFAPIAGHAFSPFLKFRGGKAIAATFGSWAGLTGYAGPLALALSMGVFYALQTVNSWTVLGGMLLFGLFLLVSGAPLALLAVWLLNLALLTYTQRSELTLASSPRGWLRARSRRAG
jgi:acyl phosphate:glycerol-3-phosphate acyltransferase